MIIDETAPRCRRLTHYHVTARGLTKSIDYDVASRSPQRAIEALQRKKRFQPWVSFRVRRVGVFPELV